MKLGQDPVFNFSISKKFTSTVSQRVSTVFTTSPTFVRSLSLCTLVPKDTSQPAQLLKNKAERDRRRRQPSLKRPLPTLIVELIEARHAVGQRYKFTDKDVKAITKYISKPTRLQDHIA